MSNKKSTHVVDHLKEEQFARYLKEYFNLLTKLLESTNKINESVDDNSFISLNANFIYSIALYEVFLGQLLQFAIKNKPSIKKKYLEIFTSVIKDKVHQHKESRWFDYRTDKQMIDNYQELEKEKHQYVLAKQLTNIDLKDKAVGTIWKRSCEARERRNLLAHRGRKPDSIYYDKVKKSHKIDDKFLLGIFKTGLYTHSTDSSSVFWNPDTQLIEKPENNVDNPTDLSITPNYLKHSILDIIYLSYVFLSCIGVKSLDQTNGEGLHDLLIYATTQKDKFVLAKCMQIYTRKIMTVHKGNATELPIADKVNFLILLEHLKDLKLIKRDKLTPLRLDSIKEDEHELALIIRDLLANYIDKNRTGFIETTKI